MNEEKLTALENANPNAVLTAEEEVPETRKRKVRYTFEMQFSRVRSAIELSINDETLKLAAAEFGYSAEKVSGLKTMFDETDGFYEAQKTALAKQMAATRYFEAKRESADRMLQHYVETARLAFKNVPNAYDDLGLRGKRKRAFGEWAAQGKYFFNRVLLPEYASVMANYQVSQADLEAGQRAILETIAAETAGENAKAEAQKATELKTKSWLKLKAAMRKYLNVMKEALEDDPQMKEKLGIVTPIVLQ